MIEPLSGKWALEYASKARDAEGNEGKGYIMNVYYKEGYENPHFYDLPYVFDKHYSLYNKTWEFTSLSDLKATKTNLVGGTFKDVSQKDISVWISSVWLPWHHNYNAFGRTKNKLNFFDHCVARF